MEKGYKHCRCCKNKDSDLCKDCKPEDITWVERKNKEWETVKGLEYGKYKDNFICIYDEDDFCTMMFFDYWCMKYHPTGCCAVRGLNSQ